MVPRSPSLFPDQPSPIPAASTPAIIAHCDGGARGNPGPAGYGAEITDAQGNVLAELSEFLGFRTNNFAEYSGLLASLQYALDHGHTALRVVSDSLLMVKQIQGAYKVKSPDLIPLWQEAKRRIARLEHFEIAHALRHKNKAADRLANDAMDRGMKRDGAAGHQPTPATHLPPTQVNNLLRPAQPPTREGSSPPPPSHILPQQLPFRSHPPKKALCRPSRPHPAPRICPSFSAPTAHPPHEQNPSRPTIERQPPPCSAASLVTEPSISSDPMRCPMAYSSKSSPSRDNDARKQTSGVFSLHSSSRPRPDSFDDGPNRFNDGM